MSNEDSIKSLSHNALAALALAHHCSDMGAHRVVIPVELNSNNYVITISKSRSRRQRVVKNPPVALSSGSLNTHKADKLIETTNENIKK